MSAFIINKLDDYPKVKNKIVKDANTTVIKSWVRKYYHFYPHDIVSIIHYYICCKYIVHPKNEYAIEYSQEDERMHLQFIHNLENIVDNCEPIELILSANNNKYYIPCIATNYCKNQHKIFIYPYKDGGGSALRYGCIDVNNQRLVYKKNIAVKRDHTEAYLDHHQKKNIVVRIF